MNKILILLIFVFIIAGGYFAGSYIFRDRDMLTIEKIISDPERYLDQDVQVRGKAVEYSAREWVILEDRGARIFVKHNTPDYYFKYGDRYIIKGEVKTGEVFGARGNIVYINAIEPPIRNNSWIWI